MTDGTEQKIRPAAEQSAPEQNSDAPAVEIELAEPNPETAAEQPRVDTKRTEAPTDTRSRLLRRKPKPAAVPQVRDELTVQIEKILEDGVSDAYARLTPIQKQEFKIKGEAVARVIGDMVRTTHIKVKKILRLIIEWLKLLPGVNRFFLEQEAKIKTDRIIALTKEK